MTGPDPLDEANVLIDALTPGPPTARQVTEAAAWHGWFPDCPNLIPAVPAALRGRDHAAAEER